jgi:hypothetical protein
VELTVGDLLIEIVPFHSDKLVQTHNPYSCLI